MRSRGSGSRKRRSERISPYAWLGAGALTLGIGAATLTGAGVAYAEDTGGDSSTKSPASSSAPSSSGQGGVETNFRSAVDSSDTETETEIENSSSDDVNIADDDDLESDDGDLESDDDDLDVIHLAEIDEEVPQASSGEETAGDDTTGGEGAMAAVLLQASVKRQEVVAPAVLNTANLATPAAAVQAAAPDVDPNLAGVVKVGPYFPEAVAASPDGRFVYAGSTNVTLTAGSIAVIDAATNTLKKTISTDFVVTGIAVAPDGRVYAAGFRPVTESVAAAVVAIINTSHRITKTITLGAGTGHYMPIVVTPDSKTVVVGWGAVTTSYVGAITTISTSSQRVIRTTTFQGDVVDLAVTPGGKTAVVAVDRYPASVLKIDLATGATTAIDLSSITSEVRSVAVSPGGLFAFVAYGGGARDVAIVSLNSGDVLDTVAISQGGSAQKIQLSADGATLFAIEGNTLHTIDVQSRATLDSMVVGPGVRYHSTDLALGRYGRVYLATHYESSVTVVRLYPANAAPILTVTVGEPKTSTGVVDGGVAAADPNGNPVTFSVSAPSRGTVTLTKFGAFKYTPTAAARHAAAAPNGPKTDSFVVTANNGAGGVATVTVIVTIAPKNSAPTATGSAGKPNDDTGVVTGKIVGRDGDKDVLSYSMTVAPSKGSVELKSDGTFSYTPTQAARHAAGAPGAKAAVKKDSFTVTVSDGHGGTKNVAVSVTIEPRKLTTSAAKLFSTMDPYTSDKLTAQLVSTSGGKKRMVVYMTGIERFFNNPDSAIVGLMGNTGWLNPIVSSFIDDAVEKWKPAEIMLVGFSNGGQQMQNYAGWSANANTKLVKSVVLFGAPLTKKADELQSASSLAIIDLHDLTMFNLTHADAYSSYADNGSDNRTFYTSITATSGDTHGQGTYEKAAANLDAEATKRWLSADVKKIYDSWKVFAGTIIDEKTHKIL